MLAAVLVWLGLVLFSVVGLLLFIDVSLRRKLKVQCLTSSDQDLRTKPQIIPHADPIVSIVRNTIDAWLKRSCFVMNLHNRAIRFRDPLGMKMMQETFMGQIFITCWDPEVANHILVVDRISFSKIKNVIGSFQDLLGHSLSQVDGDNWQRQRKVLSNVFKERCLAGMIPAVATSTDSLRSMWYSKIHKRTTPIYLNVVDWMDRLSFDILGRTILSFDLHALEDNPSKQLLCLKMMIESLDDQRRILRAYDKSNSIENLQFNRARIEVVDFLTEQRIKKSSLRMSPGAIRAGTLRKNRTRQNSAPNFDPSSNSDQCPFSKEDAASSLSSSSYAASLSSSSSSSSSSPHDNPAISSSANLQHSGSTFSTTDSVFPEDLMTLIAQEFDFTDADMMLSDREFLQNILSFFIHGQQGISSLLSICLHLLGSNSKIQQNLRRDIEKAEKDDTLSSQWHKINSLPLLSGVVKEALRMFPPVPVIYRKAAQDTQIKGYFVPKGSVISILNITTQRDPSLWKDPDQFQPSRFTVSSSSSSSPAFSSASSSSLKRQAVQGLSNFSPYGQGLRDCIGKNFVSIIVRAVLYSLIKDFSFEARGKASKLDFESGNTLRPKKMELIVRLASQQS